MEMELNSLIDKIKKDGVQAAEKQAGDIVNRAEAQAKKIIDDAEKKKSAALEDAKRRIAGMQSAQEAAVRQAGRDVLLMLRERVADFFYRIVNRQVEEALKPDTLKDVIIKAVENFKKDGFLDVDIMVSREDRARLEKTLFAALGAEMKGRVKLSESALIKKGFRIGERGKDSYFDFTDEAITEAFKKHLNPKLVELLDTGLSAEKGE